MEFFDQFFQFWTEFLDKVLHLEKYISLLLENYGQLTYWILFLVIFSETGLIVTPFLPGDSLLFFAGVFAAEGSLKLPLLIVGFVIASFAGDSFNYVVGRSAGMKLVKKLEFFIKPHHIEATQNFYKKHGPRAVGLGRFFPLLRNFTPFIAGIISMPYTIFATYSMLGSALWVVSLTTLGYYFGHLESVQKNLSWIILLFLALPLLLFSVHALKNKWSSRKIDPS